MDSRPSSTYTSASDEIEEQCRHEVRPWGRRRASPPGSSDERVQIRSSSTYHKAFVSYSVCRTTSSEEQLPPLPPSDDGTTTTSSLRSSEGTPPESSSSRRKSGDERKHGKSEYPPLPLSSKSSETTLQEQEDSPLRTSEEAHVSDESSKWSEQQRAEFEILKEKLSDLHEATRVRNNEAISASIEELLVWGSKQLDENSILKEQVKDTQTCNVNLTVENIFLKSGSTSTPMLREKQPNSLQNISEEENSPKEVRNESNQKTHSTGDSKQIVDTLDRCKGQIRCSHCKKLKPVLETMLINLKQTQSVIYREFSKILRRFDSTNSALQRLESRVQSTKAKRQPSTMPLHSCPSLASIVSNSSRADWNVPILKDSYTKRKQSKMAGRPSAKSKRSAFNSRGKLYFDDDYLHSLHEYLLISESIVEVLINHLSTIGDRMEKGDGEQSFEKACSGLTVCQSNVSMSVQPR